MKNTKPTPEQIAKFFGCSAERVREQFSANAAQMQGAADKMRASGQKQLRGYTLEQTQAMADRLRVNSER